MIPYVWKLALVSLLVVFSVSSASAQKLKVIVDQDARGPGTSDQQAILVFLQSNKFDVLGITTVSGDQWVKEETQHVLRLLEISGRSGSLGGRPSNQLCVGTEARSQGRDTRQRVRHDGWRIVRRQRRN